MSAGVAYLVLFVAAGLSLVFSTLSYACRELSRAKLDDALEARGRGELLNPIYDSAEDLAFLTATARLVANLAALLAVLALARPIVDSFELPAALLIAAAVTFVTSVAVPHAVAEHFGPRLLAALGGPLLAGRAALLPVVKIAHGLDALFGRIAGGGRADAEEHEDDYEAEILSFAEEGHREGAIDDDERRMIERVIDFGDRDAAEAMTGRPDVTALPHDASLDEARELIHTSGHSRIPVYEGDLDHVRGVLYARDLIPYVGRDASDVDVLAACRPPRFVAETKKLSDLLTEFREHKVHMGIVRDEYGAMVGLVTIEDVLEQLVGEISDEHEPTEHDLYYELPDGSYSCDGRASVAEVNRELGLELPEDDGYDTLAGLAMAVTGGIPAAGQAFEAGGVAFKVTQAERHRVNRLELRPTPAGPAARSA